MFIAFIFAVLLPIFVTCSFLFMWPLKPNHELIPILTFRGTQCHDLDHSGSRDVIVHVAI